MKINFHIVPIRLMDFYITASKNMIMNETHFSRKANLFIFAFFCKKNHFFFFNRYKSTAFQVGYHSAFYHPSPETASQATDATLCNVFQTSQSYSLPETWNLKRASALSRINIANTKTGRMRFAPTLTNVRQHPDPHLILCHSLKKYKFSFFVSREISSPLQNEINVLFLS